MDMVRCAAALLLTSAVLAGCSAGQQADIEETTVSPTSESVPVPAAVIDSHAASVVKVEGIAPACGKVFSGTGFVIGPGQVMSMAHAVAGAETVSVIAGGVSHPATVVFFDPMRDISILNVPDLTLEKLTLTVTPAAAGGDIAMLGYPGGGEFAATAARVREVVDLNGFDIYGTTPVTRQVVIFEAPVEQGNSGGPILDGAGNVVGMVFGRDETDHLSGFALSVDEIGPTQVPASAAPVATGTCVG